MVIPHRCQCFALQKLLPMGTLKFIELSGGWAHSGNYPRGRRPQGPADPRAHHSAICSGSCQCPVTPAPPPLRCGAGGGGETGGISPHPACHPGSPCYIPRACTSVFQCQGPSLRVQFFAWLSGAAFTCPSPISVFVRWLFACLHGLHVVLIANLIT